MATRYFIFDDCARPRRIYVVVGEERYVILFKRASVRQLCDIAARWLTNEQLAFSLPDYTAFVNTIKQRFK